MEILIGMAFITLLCELIVSGTPKQNVEDSNE